MSSKALRTKGVGTESCSIWTPWVKATVFLVRVPRWASRVPKLWMVSPLSEGQGNRIVARWNLLITKEEWRKSPTHMPGDREGEHAQEHMGSHPVLTPAIDRTQS